MIPTPNLDDRNFEQLRREAIDHIRSRGGAWDDLGDTDPGVLLIEAFAYLTDLLLYRLNRVPDKVRVELLNLLGVSLRPPTAATTELTFSLTDAASSTADSPVIIPAGTEVRAGGNDESETLTFVVESNLQLSAEHPQGRVGARHYRQMVAEKIGVGNGFRDQRFVLANAPVLAPTGNDFDLLLAVEADDQHHSGARSLTVEGRRFDVWLTVDTGGRSAPSGPDGDQDRYSDPPGRFRVDRVSGQVIGSVPQGREVRAWYRYGGGAGGNVGLGKLNELVEGGDSGGLAGKVAVTNTTRAVGGRDPETVEEALGRASVAFRDDGRAITADDYQNLACSQRAIARARASTASERWAHAKAGTVELCLVPHIGTDRSPAAADMEVSRVEQLRQQIQSIVTDNQPLGVGCEVRWCSYKEVAVHLDVIVSAVEDPQVLADRLTERLYRILSPVASATGPEPWPFGQALSISAIYRAATSEPGVITVERAQLEIPDSPEGQVGWVAADPNQPSTWYAAVGGDLYRSENDGRGWELILRLDGSTIGPVAVASERPGGLAVVTNRPGRSEVRVSYDCGQSGLEVPVGAFSWDQDDPQHEVNDLAWFGQGADFDLALATDRGLYRMVVADATPQPWAVDSVEAGVGNGDVGYWTVAIGRSPLGLTEVAVGAKNGGGVWLWDSESSRFRSAMAPGEDIRRLMIQADGSRRYLWAASWSVGDEVGRGPLVAELLRTPGRELSWATAGEGWEGGTCYDIAFTSDQVLAASHFKGVMRLVNTDGAFRWQYPSVRTSALPLTDKLSADRQFAPVRTISGSSALAIVGTVDGLFNTVDGINFDHSSRRVFNDSVTIPSDWLFASGHHRVSVSVEGQPDREPIVGRRS